MKRITLILLLLFPLSASTALAITLEDITINLRCPCGCTYVVANCDIMGSCTAAEETNAWVRQMLDEGKTDKEIYALFAAKYGIESIATMPKEGFGLTLWLFPVVALVIGGGIVYHVARTNVHGFRKTLASGEKQEHDFQGEMDEKYEKIFEEEFERFKRS